MSDFMITGRRCGTTALASALERLDNVCVSLPKEPRTFECKDDPTLDEYGWLFEIGTEIYVSARSRMMTLPFALERAKNLMPKLKIVYLVKNPIMRAFSDWQFYKSTFPNEKHSPFFHTIKVNFENFDMDCYSTAEKYLKARYKTGPSPHRFLEDGMYSHHLNTAFRYFSRDEIFVTDLSDTSRGEYENLIKFLDLPEDTSIYADRMNKVKKDFEITPAILKELDEITYSKMHTLYKEDVMDLSVLTGKDYLGRWGF